MYSLVALLSAAASALALAAPRPDVVARALYPRQSNGVCMFDTCPTTDLGFVANTGTSTTGTTLTCSYSGEMCNYDTTTGLPVVGNPDGCPTMADAGGCAAGRRRAQYKREDNYTAMLRKMAAREAARKK